MVGGEPGALPRRGPLFGPRHLGPQGRDGIIAKQAWLGFAGLMLSGTLVALSAARTTLLLPSSARPVPSSLAGAFGDGGINLGLGGLIAVLGLMFVSYAVMVRGAHWLTARPVLIGIACLNLLLLLAPPLLSTDVFSYVAYGRIGAVYGSNPYLHGPNAIAFDPLYPFIAAKWIKTPTTYGPLFTGLSYLLAPLNVAVNVIAYKTIAAVSSLVVVLMVWSAARLRGLSPVKAVAIVGLNPVIVVFGIGGGHNDLLMLAILLIGVYALLAQKQRSSGALIVTAVAIKLTAAVMLPFALAQSASRQSGQRGRRAVLAGAGIAAAIVVGLSFAAFGTGPLHLLPTLQQIQSRGGLHSIPGLVLTLLGHQELTSDIGLVLDAFFVVSVVWLVRQVWMGRLDWISGAGWATVVMLITAGFLVPWYVAWLVPLAALSSNRRLLAVTVVLTGLGLTTL
jgi:alpha-1,6-mannosyltransferase